MKKILIVDTNYGFTSDVESRLILDEIDNVEISTRNKVDGLHDVISSTRPDELLIFANLLTSHPSWDFGVPVKTYAKDTNGITISAEHGFQCYGIVKNAGDLITAIEQNKIVKVEQSAPAANTPEPAPQPTSQIVSQPQTEINNTYNQPQNEYNNNFNNQNNYNNYSPTQSSPQPYNNPQNYGQQQAPIQQQAPQQDFMNSLKNNREALLAALLAGQKGNQPQAPNPYGQNSGNGYGQNNGNNYNNPYNQPYGNRPYNQPDNQGWNNNGSGNYQNGQLPYNDTYRNNNGNGYGNQMDNGYNNPYNQNPYEQDVSRDMRMIKPKAKVISAYSAKGGVGKTTISCELATYLALTSNGRSNFKVCIADFNIDFGNVINTLDYDPKRACMSLWAADIRERLKYGENPDSINYTEPQIETFLQRKNKDGLYALLAPLTNADSMEISPVEIQVMLRNLIYNGGFDFVVCDTGNNTRDTTCIALENSDNVFMILTQSVNAANANQSFLKTMMASNFDMSKVKTIVNMIKSEKDVGATVKEVEESILNPATGRPFECVARIKDMNAVRNSENTGEPLVYNASHDFTREITGLAKYVIGDDFELPELPKKNLIVDLFSKLKR